MSVLRVLGQWISLALMTMTLVSCSHNGAANKDDEMASVRESFDDLAKAWADQCTTDMCSSDGDMPAQQEAFKKLVAMGPQIAPLVVDRMRQNQKPSDRNPNVMEYDPQWLPWEWVLEEVTGFHLADDPAYRKKVREYHWKVAIEEPSKDPNDPFSETRGILTENDIKVRKQRREEYRKAGPEAYSDLFDPEGKGYVPDVAVPHLLDWWDKVGVKKFGSNATEGKNG